MSAYLINSGSGHRNGLSSTDVDSEVMMTMLNGEDVIPYRHNPNYCTLSIRDECGNFAMPTGGQLCMKVENPPHTRYRQEMRNFSDVFTLETLIKILELSDNAIQDNLRYHVTGEYRSKLGRNVSKQSPIAFIHNVRPFGVTSLYKMERMRRTSPATQQPILLSGSPYESLNDLSEDDTFKIPGKLYLSEACDNYVLSTHTRLEVFLTVDSNFKFNIIITQFHSLDDWMTSTLGKRYIKEHIIKYLCYIKLGYTHDRRTDKVAVRPIQNGEYYQVCNFIFSPDPEGWVIRYVGTHTTLLSNHPLRVLSDHFAGRTTMAEKEIDDWNTIEKFFAFSFSSNLTIRNNPNLPEYIKLLENHTIPLYSAIDYF